MKRTMMTIVVMVVMVAVASQPASAYWRQQQDVADIIRATGEAGGTIIGIVQHRKSYELAEREQRFQQAQQVQQVRYYDIPASPQGQRISQIRREQELEQLIKDNQRLQESVRQATAALTAALKQQKILIEEVRRLQEENEALREQLSLRRPKPKL